VAALIEDIEVPVDIEHWIGTKQHFGEQLALALAREFQSAGKT